MGYPQIEGFASVDLEPAPLERFSTVLEPEAFTRFIGRAAMGRVLLAGRVVWNVNSTATGGGVAEMLRALLPYVLDAGVDARWLVLHGDPDFFRLTKRIHNRLHGSPGDGGDLGAAEREAFVRASAGPGAALAAAVGARDVVILHDPQTAGLCEALRARGARVIWRCHVGVDQPNEAVRSAWDFIRPFIGSADAYVFSKRSFAWQGLPPEKIQVIPPSIDPFAAKNIALEPQDVESILGAAGVLAERTTPEATFRRADGTLGRVRRGVQHDAGGPIPSSGRQVVQVSRWDALKDPIGVLRAFAEHIGGVPDAHLVLAGPAGGVADDPEADAVLTACREACAKLPPSIRARAHLFSVPVEDTEENAVIVNAIQRRANVLVQKSLEEGFGLTVTEGMWKSRAVVASRVGGIEEQIEDGRSGVLVDPRDLAGFGRAVVETLQDPELARRLGAAAFRRARDAFLPPSHLTRYLELIERLVGDSRSRSPS